MKNFTSVFANGLARAFAVYAFIAALHTRLTVFYPEIHWEETYFVLLLLICAVALVWDCFREPRRDLEWSKPETIKYLVVFLCVAAFIAVARFRSMDVASLWGDEVYQGDTAYTMFPVQAGASQHQPPLDFALGHWAQVIFQTSVFALRIHPVVFSTLAALLLFTMMYDAFSSLIVVAAATLLFAFHWLIVRYGMEARPISLGIFTFLLLLQQLQQFWSLEFQKKKLEWFVPWAKVVALALLCLLALGLQPPFAIAAAFLTFLALALKRRFRKKALLLASAMIVAVFAFLPIQIFIFENAPPRFPTAFSAGLSRYVGHFEKLSFAYGWHHVGRLAWLLVVIAIPWLILSVMIKRKPASKSWPPVNIVPDVTFPMLILFPVLLVPFFLSYVAWHLNDYYTIFVLPLFWLTIVGYLGYYSRLFRIERPITAFALVAFLVCLPKYPIGIAENAHGLYRRSELKEFFGYIEGHATRYDLIYNVDVNEGWFDNLWGWRYYYRFIPADQGPAFPKSEYLQWLDGYLSNKTQPRTVFLSFYEDPVPLTALIREMPVLFPDVEILHFGIQLVFKIENREKNVLRILEKTFKLVDRNYAASLKSWMPVEALVIVLLHEGRFEEARKYLDKLLALPTPPDRWETLERYGKRIQERRSTD